MRRLTVTARAAIIAQLAAVVCLVVAYAKRNDVRLDGVLFGAIDRVSTPLIDYDIAATPWLIAGGALMVCALGLFVADALRRRG